MGAPALRFEYQVAIRRSPRPDAPCRGDATPSATPGEFAPVQRLLALAYEIENRIRSGVLPNYAAAARWLCVTRARVSQIVGLAFLAPSIQERILRAMGREAAVLHERELRTVAAEAVWAQQEARWEAIRCAPGRIASAAASAAG